MEWTNWLTLGIAVLGATLGVVNFVWTVRKDMVRIRARGRMIGVASVAGFEHFTVGVEVVNVGYLPVTITEVAFQRGYFARERLPIVSDFHGVVSLPHRLDARTSVFIAGSPDLVELVDTFRVTHCRAVTACGVKVVSKIRRG